MSSRRKSFKALRESVASVSLEESQSLGAKVDWVKDTYGGPTNSQVLTILMVLFLSWASLYSLSYVLLEYLIFPDIEETKLSSPTLVDGQENVMTTTDSFWAADMDPTNFATFSSFLFPPMRAFPF